MQRESMEIALVKYNKKTWCKSALLGFFVGLAVIVPGISGSTVAIIFKLYDQFLYALGNLFKKFKQCFLFLLPIGIGIVIGVLLGFIAVKQLLEILPFAIVCLFAGLMSGAFPAVKDELKGAQRNAKRVALFCLGLLVPVALGCFSAVSTLGATETVVDKFANVQWWHVLLALVFGAVVGITQIVPGLSASAFLMSVGWFGSIMQSVSMTYWKSNPQVFLVYAGLVVGFVVGLLGFSKLLTYVFAKARHTAYSMIVGLSLGSILSMFCNGDIVETYLSWSQNGASVLDIVLGVVLFALGAVGAYLLVRYQRKKDAETAKTNAGD
ncbi:MAG: DUF368 domain-containing protein [Clostridia bacterium]|nr:DUF368 domain-containing protein [Clostridia bacterium]